MLKVMKGKAIVKLQNRVTARVEEDRAFLQAGTANKYVAFGILVTNPTPWELQIVDITCSIIYNDIILMRKALVIDPLPIKLERETVRGKLVYIHYDPFSSPVGLPSNQKGWRIEGTLHLLSYFGKFDVPVPEQLFTKGQLAQESQWIESLHYVRENIGRVNA